MVKVKHILPILVLASVALAIPACSSQQAEQKTNEVTDQTGSAVGSVLDAVGSVVMWPFHLVGDLFS
ncbi:MAG TPA: hypothetical protein VMV27_11650 [Candidatus Binataceae bacterium]|nr:hypothetical protein [Candidatus Binataceae bacterium]